MLTLSTASVLTQSVSLHGAHETRHCHILIRAMAEISGLRTCTRLRSVFVTTARGGHAYHWNDALIILASLPHQVQLIRFITDVGSARGTPILSYLQSLDWPELGRSLGHCTSLQTLELGIENYRKYHVEISLTRETDIQEMILSRLPPDLGSKVLFL